MPDSTVAVAMSGGVDSSVAAAVLKERGRSVIGIGLQLVEEPGDGRAASRGCCGSRELDDARRVAQAIDIPFYVLDFTDVFREHVIDYFVSSYLAGLTPNPCVPCNEVVKFDVLLEKAARLGADTLATGHYARIEKDARTGRYSLLKGIDAAKDQSYFLYSLSQEQLARAVFPMGGVSKDRTREKARELGLEVHDKPESQDICFVGPGGYAEFVSSRAGVAARPGPILDEAGRMLGTHKGLYHYTVGQRHGLGVSLPEPVYVVDIDPASNSITVAPGASLPRQEKVSLERVNYVTIEKPSGPIRVEAVTRYRKAPVPAVLLPGGRDTAVVEFDGLQEPTAPGQSVVLYEGDRALAGGVARR